MQKKRRKYARMTLNNRIFDVFNYTALGLLLLVFVAPLMNVISSSFSDPDMIAGGKVWLLPKGFTLEGYQEVRQMDKIWIGYANSVYYTVVGTLANLIVTIMCAYPLSKKDLVGRNFIMGIFSFTMFFGGGLVPTFMLVRSLGLLDTRAALILPGLMSVYNMIIARTFFSTSIPSDLYDAAEIDGCNEFSTLIRIVIPLSAPIIAVLGLYYAVAHWNSYFSGLIYLSDSSKYPLQLVLRDFLLSQQSWDDMLTSASAEMQAEIVEQMKKREQLRYVVIVVAALPMCMLYPFIQKFFIKGVMVGAIKG